MEGGINNENEKDETNSGAVKETMPPKNENEEEETNSGGAIKKAKPPKTIASGKSSPPSEPVSESSQEHTDHDTKAPLLKKIDVLLKATGDAPIMKKKKWAVEGDKQVGWVTQFIRKFLKLEESDNLFLYVNQSFAPAPDNLVRNLYQCFGCDGKLVLHYCLTQAWG